MNLRQVIRAVVCPAIVALCIAGEGLFPAQSVTGQQIEPADLHKAAAIDQSKQAGQAKSLQVGTNQIRYRSGLQNAPGKKRISPKYLKQVLLNLQEKTGWQSLYFDEAGFLVCPAPKAFSGGSAAARRLLGAALSSDEHYDLEAWIGSSDVAFARLEPIGVMDYRTRAEFRAHLLQIDFADFNQLQGHGAALKSFDLGIAILHEIAHGVWRLEDAAPGIDEPGDCENYINQIRRELHLPERQTYRAQTRIRTGALHRSQLVAELRFIHTSEKHGQTRQERFSLLWNTETVGGVVDFRTTAKPNLR